jgi:mono/diheme cytochrome c family protein
VKVVFLTAGLLLTLTAMFARAQAPATPDLQKLPPAAADQVDFARDVVPILNTSCVRCHGRGKARGGFSLETRAAMMEGGDTGDAVLPGKSGDSLLIHLVAGLDPDNVMPQKGSRLKPAQIGVLRAWIDQGAPWPDAINFAKAAPRNLHPTKRVLPPLPAGALMASHAKTNGSAAAAFASSTNPVDRLLAPYFEKNAVTPGALASDRRLVRRVYLDVIGLPPSPDQVTAFVDDRRVDKLDRLVAALLADRERYAEHWLSFWNDALRNDYRGTGYIDGGRRQITAWLYAALANNLPYDEFVAQLVNPGRGAEGFTKGIVWRGVVNASQTPPMQAAQNISQVFMGVNLKCASCHDSFINDWQLADAYGLASIYADGPLEMVECDRPTGKTSPTRFIYAELGKIDPAAPRAARLAQLASVITGPKNGRLSRTVVNRLWARFLGRGLVEPLDDMEQASWHPALLDWLAEDLVANGYDLKKTMARILTSRAYRLAAVDVPDQVEQFVFRGPAIRRMSAEQFADSLSAVTGVWAEKPLGDFDYIAAGLADTPDTSKTSATSTTPKTASAAKTAKALTTPHTSKGYVVGTRAAMITADPLMVALGRPNREQVTTSRAAAATTLQALELANGSTLAGVLEKGAKKLLAEAKTADQMIDLVYQRALGRAPTENELALCRSLLGGEGKEPTAAGVEDLLWAVAMLPEFQLVD